LRTITPQLLPSLQSMMFHHPTHPPLQQGSYRVTWSREARHRTVQPHNSEGFKMLVCLRGPRYCSVFFWEFLVWYWKKPKPPNFKVISDDFKGTKLACNTVSLSGGWTQWNSEPNESEQHKIQLKSTAISLDERIDVSDVSAYLPYTNTRSFWRVSLSKPSVFVGGIIRNWPHIKTSLQKVQSGENSESLQTSPCCESPGEPCWVHVPGASSEIEVCSRNRKS